MSDNKLNTFRILCFGSHHLGRLRKLAILTGGGWGLYYINFNTKVQDGTGVYPGSDVTRIQYPTNEFLNNLHEKVYWFLTSFSYTFT